MLRKDWRRLIGPNNQVKPGLEKKKSHLQQAFMISSKIRKQKEVRRRQVRTIKWLRKDFPWELSRNEENAKEYCMVGQDSGEAFLGVFLLEHWLTLQKYFPLKQIL